MLDAVCQLPINTLLSLQKANWFSYALCEYKIILWIIKYQVPMISYTLYMYLLIVMQ